MFAKLKGFVDLIAENYIILDVNDVGYLVYCSSKTINEIAPYKEKISLFIHTNVKEDSISLYGFNTNLEQIFFNHLITVQGIGPRLAIVILSYLGVDEIMNAIITKNKTIFKAVPGVGPKLVERIFIELENKFKNLSLTTEQQSHFSTKILEDNITADAILALTNLGYHSNQVTNLVKKLRADGPDLKINQLIKLSLKELNQK